MAGTIDVAAERAATPGCSRVAYLNNAGAALPTSTTLAVQTAHLQAESELGGYLAAARASDRLAAVRESGARLFGVGAPDVVVTGSDTEGWSRAVWGFVLGGNLMAGKRVLVDRIVYDSHYLALLQSCRMTGGSIRVVTSLPDGTVDLEALATELADGEVGLVALTHIGTHRGLVNPVEEAGARCRQAGVPLFLDVCQSAGQMPLDLRSIGCAVATATGRKWLRGPRGTGLLYVERSWAERLDPPGIGWSSVLWIDEDHYRLREGADRFVDFEVPVAAHLGLGEAINHALALGLDAIAARIGGLADRLRQELADLPGVLLHDGGSRRSGIVTFTVEGADPAELVTAAARGDVSISVSEAPWARLDMRPPHPPVVARASPHYYNTEQELERLVASVASVAAVAAPGGS